MLYQYEVDLHQRSQRSLSSGWMRSIRWCDSYGDDRTGIPDRTRHRVWFPARSTVKGSSPRQPQPPAHPPPGAKRPTAPSIGPPPEAKPKTSAIPNADTQPESRHPAPSTITGGLPLPPGIPIPPSKAASQAVPPKAGPAVTVTILDPLRSPPSPYMPSVPPSPMISSLLPRSASSLADPLLPPRSSRSRRSRSRSPRRFGSNPLDPFVIMGRLRNWLENPEASLLTPDTRPKWAAAFRGLGNRLDQQPDDGVPSGVLSASTTANIVTGENLVPPSRTTPEPPGKARTVPKDGVIMVAGGSGMVSAVSDLPVEARTVYRVDRADTPLLPEPVPVHPGTLPPLPPLAPPPPLAPIPPLPPVPPLAHPEPLPLCRDTPAQPPQDPPDTAPADGMDLDGVPLQPGDSTWRDPETPNTSQVDSQDEEIQAHYHRKRDQEPGETWSYSTWRRPSKSLWRGVWDSQRDFGPDWSFSDDEWKYKGWTEAQWDRYYDSWEGWTGDAQQHRSSESWSYGRNTWWEHDTHHDDDDNEDVEEESVHESGESEEEDGDHMQGDDPVYSPTSPVPDDGQAPFPPQPPSAPVVIDLQSPDAEPTWIIFSMILTLMWFRMFSM